MKLRNVKDLTNMQCRSAPDPRSRWKKIKHWLFPSEHCFAPEAQGEYKDCIHGTAVSKLSWKDRVRVVLTGVVVTQWRTLTQNEAGSTSCNATCHIGTSDDLR